MKYILAFIIPLSVFSQKNSLTARPLNAVIGCYGLSYERLITERVSVLLYGEYIWGPHLGDKNINSHLAKTMDGYSGTVKYSGWGMEVESRYYFRKKEIELVEDVSKNSVIGWYIGAYVPYREVMLKYSVVTAEHLYYATQKDEGILHGLQQIYGVGATGGKHWVWGKFTLELNLGFSLNKGVGFSRELMYTRPGIEEYYRTKDMGFLGNYTFITPRVGLNMGISF
ncbi:MAG: hypothetical protein NW207_03955 [Cytophagales bacterium]|nr:hypothetical protein [Cytophagales bacterium]